MPVMDYEIVLKITCARTK